MNNTSTDAVQDISEKDRDVLIKSSKTYLVLKRLIDVLASIIGLLLLAPLFLILSILIKIEDPKGVVFFKQKRVGKGEKIFNMYKFRSMVSNAEELFDELLEHNEVKGAMFKMKNDPRTTKLGRIIRKTSIDELPQLINVLKGEMSLVGPRPPLIREVEEYSVYHKQRLLIKPGCTGLWQVSARNKVGFDEMVEMDLQYMKNRNVLLDLKLIFKTVLVMLNSKAY